MKKLNLELGIAPRIIAFPGRERAEFGSGEPVLVGLPAPERRLP
jgi:hypothetical protein